MGAATVFPSTISAPKRFRLGANALGIFCATIACWAAVFSSQFAHARVDSDPTRSNEIVKLHLPVNIEGRQTIRLQRLVDEYYDIDLDEYVLREVVLETDGATDRADAYARLQVGRYRTGRIRISDNLTSLEAPGVHHDRWRLQLGSGVRAHGILLVLSERSYREFRTHSHAGISHGLVWYGTSRDYYHLNRFARPHFYNRYHHDLHGYYRGVWYDDYRRGYRDGLGQRHRLLRQRRAEERYRRSLQREREMRQDRPKHERPRERHEREPEHRQWRGSERRAAVQRARQSRPDRAQRTRQARPDRVQQRRVTVERPQRAERAQRPQRAERAQQATRAQQAAPRIRSSRSQPRRSVNRPDRSTPRTRVRYTERVR